MNSWLVSVSQKSWFFAKNGLSHDVSENLETLRLAFFPEHMGTPQCNSTRKPSPL